MTTDLIQLDIRDSREWRKWLEKHHASSPGIWLVCYKDHTGLKSIPYEDLVREALCFGWIDSLIKRLDDDRYARKITPRKPASKWSDLNRKRWNELKAANRLTAAGLAAAPTGNKYSPIPTVPELPAYIAKALEAKPPALQFFQGLAPTYRRQFVGWIHLAKQPETRQRRLREALALLAAGKKLGLR